MSAHLNAMLGLPEDPRQVELVKGLLAKTQQGKIGWVKQGMAFTASLPNGIVVNFVLAAAIGGMNWQLFTVRDKKGNELVRVDSWGAFAIVAGPTKVAGPARVAGPATISPLLAATDELFATVRGATGDVLDRAIESLKNL